MYKVIIYSLMMFSMGFSQSLLWSEADNSSATISCSGEVTQGQQCSVLVTISMKTIVQCPDGRQLRVYDSKSIQSEDYFASGLRNGTTSLSVLVQDNNAAFSAQMIDDLYFEGDFTFQDSDAEYNCHITGFTDEDDLIQAGDFENSEDYPSIGITSFKTFKFDNYSGGGWCEKDADAEIDHQTKMADSDLSIRCRDFDPRNGNIEAQTGQYVSEDGYVGIHKDWNSPTWVGDGYSKLFPGGQIVRVDKKGFRGSDASEHTRISMTKEAQDSIITLFPEMDNGIEREKPRYNNQGRVEMVVSKLQDDQYRMEEGGVRWYGLSFKIQSDDVINSYTLDEGVISKPKREYLKNRVPVSAIISQLHNANNKQAYFSIYKDPVNSKMYLSFAHDISCPDNYTQLLYQGNPCKPDFEENGIYDASVKLDHFNTQEIENESDYNSSQAFKYTRVEGGQLKYYKITGRTLRFNEYAIDKGKWYHLRYKLKAQVQENPTNFKSISGRISAQMRSDDGKWVNFKYRSPNADENTNLDRELYPEGTEGQEVCSAGGFYDSYLEPLENNESKTKLRSCNTQITDVPTFTHEYITKGSITKIDNNDIKFGWYGKSYPDDTTGPGELTSTIIIDNVSAAPLKDQLKKPLREDIIQGYNFGSLPLSEVSSISINFTKVNSGLRLDLTTSWNTMEILPQIAQPSTEYKEVKVELHASIPANHVSSFYHGNIQLLFGWDWVGQFDLWMDPSYFQYDSETGMYNYIVEFNLPAFAAHKINDPNNLVDVRLAVSSSNDLDHIVLHSLNFIGLPSLETRDLTESLQSHGNKIGVSITGLKNSAKDIYLMDSQSSTYNIWYKTMVDPTDDVSKKFYYLIGQDVVYSMPGVVGWTQLQGYVPDVPWKPQSNSSWRQVWKYLGNEI